MGYFIRSIATRSFWKYALLSGPGFARWFATVGVIWTFMEILDFLGIYERAQYSKFALFPILIAGVIYAAARVRPVYRVIYKVPNRDVCIEIRIGDLIDAAGEVVISSNTTFDTDISTGLISGKSLQGQLANKVFQGNTQAIDSALNQSLSGIAGTPINRPFGKQVEYPVGTIACVNSHSNRYYFVAMSKFNAQGNAYSTIEMVDTALSSLWSHIEQQGDFDTISVPLVGTGRGRLPLPRKKMAERIAQSFLDASRNRSFAKKLSIYIYPADAEYFEVNLFEMKDYLTQSLHT
jgi:hypothetical protein